MAAKAGRSPYTIQKPTGFSRLFTDYLHILSQFPPSLRYNKVKNIGPLRRAGKGVKYGQPS